MVFLLIMLTLIRVNMLQKFIGIKQNIAYSTGKGQGLIPTHRMN